MDNGHICNIPVTEGEITIVKATDAEEIMKHSCRLAMASRKRGTGVLVINTGLSKRRFKEAATTAGIEWTQTRNTNAIVSPGPVPLIVQTSVAGELSSQLEDIRTVCEEAKIKVIVVTAWEWTSSSYRRKENLVFGLRKLLDEMDVAVIVYTQSPNSITRGKYARGGVGKLAMVAYNVVSLESLPAEAQDEADADMLVTSGKPQPILSGGAQLLPKKINTLPEKFAEERTKEKGQREMARELALAA